MEEGGSEVAATAAGWVGWALDLAEEEGVVGEGAVDSAEAAAVGSAV